MKVLKTTSTSVDIDIFSVGPLTTDAYGEYKIPLQFNANGGDQIYALYDQYSNTWMMINRDNVPPFKIELSNIIAQCNSVNTWIMIKAVISPLDKFNYGDTIHILNNSFVVVQQTIDCIYIVSTNPISIDIDDMVSGIRYFRSKARRMIEEPYAACIMSNIYGKKEILSQEIKDLEISAKEIIESDLDDFTTIVTKLLFNKLDK